MEAKAIQRTIDGDGNSLVEDVAISTNEGRDLSERVNLQVLGVLRLGIGRDNLEVEVVGLRNGEDARRARVALQIRFRSVLAPGRRSGNKYCTSTHIVSVELAERHLCSGS